MDIRQIFSERYAVLYDFYLAGIWQSVPEALMRQRPHPRTNSIAWILWHVSRVEDAGLNRFVADRPQVLDDGEWLARLNIPWRHQGSGMTSDEVDELNRQIDLPALRAYSGAIQARTQEILSALDPQVLDELMERERLGLILFDEGLAGPQAAGLLENYLGWNKGRCLLHFGLTHSFQHVGEIEVLASLLGVDW